MNISRSQHHQKQRNSSLLQALLDTKDSGRDILTPAALSTNYHGKWGLPGRIHLSTSAVSNLQRPASSLGVSVIASYIGAACAKPASCSRQQTSVIEMPRSRNHSVPISQIIMNHYVVQLGHWHAAIECDKRIPLHHLLIESRVAVIAVDLQVVNLTHKQTCSQPVLHIDERQMPQVQSSKDLFVCQWLMDDTGWLTMADHD